MLLGSRADRLTSRTYHRGAPPPRMPRSRVQGTGGIVSRGSPTWQACTEEEEVRDVRRVTGAGRGRRGRFLAGASHGLDHPPGPERGGPARALPAHRSPSRATPPIIEVVVADGGSTDGTRSVASKFAKVRVVDNPRRIRPAGLNTAIAAASGDIIVRVDARTALAPDYVERCVSALERSGAAIVGGQMRYEAHDARRARHRGGDDLPPRSRARGLPA